MKKKLLPFILTLSLWFVFVGRVNIQVFLLGTIICSIISFMMVDNVFRLVQVKYGTKEFFLKIYYIFLVVTVLIYDVFLSAVRVSKHAFEIKPSLSPRVVRIKTSLENTNSIAILAHFTTLTKGTLVTDFDTLNRSYSVHLINAHSDDEAKAKIALISKHERLIAKIFD